MFEVIPLAVNTLVGKVHYSLMIHWQFDGTDDPIIVQPSKFTLEHTSFTAHNFAPESYFAIGFTNVPNIRVKQKHPMFDMVSRFSSRDEIMCSQLMTSLLRTGDTLV